MRSQFVQVASENEAWNLCPWANQVIESVVGFMCFEDPADGTEFLLQQDAALAAINQSPVNAFRVQAG